VDCRIELAIKKHEEVAKAIESIKPLLLPSPSPQHADDNDVAIITDIKACAMAINHVMHHRYGHHLHKDTHVDVYFDKDKAHKGVICSESPMNHDKTGLPTWKVKLARGARKSHHDADGDTPRPQEEGWYYYAAAAAAAADDDDDDYYAHQLRLLEIRVGDRVMCTENLPGYVAVNGDRGTVLEVLEAAEDDGIASGGSSTGVLYKVALSRGGEAFIPHKSIDLGYAGTVHKYQGTEVSHVIVLLNSTREGFANRNLFHTAMSRYINKLDIVAPEGVVKEQARQLPPLRRTYLSYILRRQGREEERGKGLS